MSEPIRVAVTGGAGRIAYALVFRIASGAMFGPDRPVALSLLDVEERRPLLEAIAMELDDGAFPLLASVRQGAGASEAFAGADWVILLGGAPIRAGMSRPEMVLANAPIIRDHARAINEACPASRVLVVANPCNTNARVARAFARDVPAGHWFAMTRLDQNRAQAMLAARAGVPVAEVNRVTAWGNHSPSVFVDFHNSFIGERPAPEVISDPAWVRDVFEAGVAHRGMELVATAGASPAGSAAQAILATVRSITTPTPLLRRFSAAVVSDGSYGVPRGLFFGFPLRTEDGVGWSIVEGLYHDEHSQGRLAANVAELEYEASAADQLLGNAPPGFPLA